MDYVVFFLFIIVALAGLFSIILGFPGNFIIFAGSLFYGWYCDFKGITLEVLLLLLILAISAEVLEFIIGIAGSRKHKSSNRAIIGSIMGGIVGAIFGAPILFGAGAILGAFIGAFLGAFIVELVGSKGFDQALQSGWGAFLGRVGGTITKGIIGITMISIAVFSVIGK